MLRLCLVFWKSEPHYAYKHYAYKRKNMYYDLFLGSIRARNNRSTQQMIIKIIFQSISKNTLQWGYRPTNRYLNL